MKAIIATAFILGALTGAVVADTARSISETCSTDSECFAQCEKDWGRPCEDRDVFGPPEREEEEQADAGKPIPNFDADAFRAEALRLRP